MNRAGDTADDDDHRPVHKRADKPTPQRNVNVNAAGTIPDVNPASAHAHLAVLRRFCALYNLIENSGGATKDEDKARQVELFLSCAESRYLRYLQLLELHYKSGQRRDLPMPPWDVAIIFHAHLLSPFRFYADMSCRGPHSLLIDSKVFFPLEQLHHLITHDIWSDADSQRQWTKAFPTKPYQLWDADPFTTAAPLQLQDVDIACPFCNEVIPLDLTKFTLMHTRQKDHCFCPSCDKRLDVDRLSCEKLRRDLLSFLSSPTDIWYLCWRSCTDSNLGEYRQVKGVVFESDGTFRRPEEVRYDLELILDPGNIPRPCKPTETKLKIYLTPAPDCERMFSWNGFFNAFRLTVGELKAHMKWKYIHCRNIFGRLRVAYQGLIWRDLSIDLVAAALRQRGFADKITGEDCNGIDSPMALVHAITRYHKFMLLKRDKVTGKIRKLVPTLDVDLCWHTHQLRPVEYRSWCKGQLGRLINHDDTLSKDDLQEGLRDTTLAWYAAYRERYTTNDLKKDYLTAWRKLAGLLVPLYGLYVLNKARKLTQAQRGIIIRPPQKLIVSGCWRKQRGET